MRERQSRDPHWMIFRPLPSCCTHVRLNTADSCSSIRTYIRRYGVPYKLWPPESTFTSTLVRGGLVDLQRFSTWQEFFAPLLWEDTRIIIVNTYARISADTYIHSITAPLRKFDFSPTWRMTGIVWSGYTAAWCHLTDTTVNTSTDTEVHISIMIRLYDQLKEKWFIQFIGAPTILFSFLKFRLVLYVCLPNPIFGLERWRYTELSKMMIKSKGGGGNNFFASWVSKTLVKEKKTKKERKDS